MAARITLYGKPGCHLCEEARALLAAMAEPFELDVVEVDISQDRTLARRFGSLIPVADVAGGPALFWPFDAGALLEALAEAQA